MHTKISGHYIAARLRAEACRSISVSNFQSIQRDGVLFHNGTLQLAAYTTQEARVNKLVLQSVMLTNRVATRTRNARAEAYAQVASFQHARCATFGFYFHSYGGQMHRARGGLA